MYFGDGATSHRDDQTAALLGLLSDKYGPPITTEGHGAVSRKPIGVSKTRTVLRGRHFAAQCRASGLPPSPSWKALHDAGHAGRWAFAR